MEKGLAAAGEEFLTKEKVQWAEAGDRSRSITPKPHMLHFAFSIFLDSNFKIFLFNPPPFSELLRHGDTPHS